MTRKELENTVADYLDSLSTMTLSCCVDNVPWAAAVYYARMDFDLVFFSSKASRHATILARNSQAAATVQGDYRGWREIKGLQMEGTVESVTGVVTRTRAYAAYLKKYPFAADFLSASGSVSLEVARKMANVTAHLFRPRSILYLNNEAGFGTRWKLEIKDGRPVGEAVLVARRE